jgi:RND family efflux transporter MFP subunit
MRVCRGAVIALLIASVSGCGKKGGEPAAQIKPVAVQGASVAAVAVESIPEVQEAVGTVKARNLATVSARIAGSVSGVFVKEGERVSKGKLLAVIEAAEGGAAAAGAASGAEEAARGVEEARARQKLADATLARYRKLFNEKAVTPQEFEGRQMEQEVAAQGVARAAARLSQAQQGAKGAGTIAGYGKVTAPISGVVVSKQVEAGQTVFPATPLITVEGDDGFRLEVAAGESLLGRVKLGDLIGVDVPGAPVTGRISEIVPIVDPVNRTFTVKVDLPAKGIRSGTYGKALFRVGSRQGIAVPAIAVVDRGSLTSVWVVSREGIARLRLVKLGSVLGSRVEILSGLNAGERIVTSGAEKVTDGAKVE